MASSSNNTAAKSLKNVPHAKIRHDYHTLQEETAHFVQDNEFSKTAKPATSAFVARVMRGWKTFVAPHTPPYGFSCPPSDPFLDYVHLLLSGMYMALDKAGHKQAATISSQMTPLWPDIWIWLRTSYAHSQKLSGLYEAINRSRGYELIIRMLVSIVFLDPPTPLCTLVMETEGVLEMMATMWVKEGMDTSGTYGFKASSLLAPPHSDATWKILSQIMGKCGGSADAVAKILLHRIKNNAKQEKPDWDCYEQDFRHLLTQLSLEHDDTPGGAIMRQAIISHPTFATFMVDVLSILVDKTSQPMDTRLAGALLYPMVAIQTHFQLLKGGYDTVVQLVGTNIVTLIAQLAHTHDWRDDVVETSGRLLEMFARFAIYRPLLYRTGRNLMASGVDSVLTGRGGKIGQNMMFLASLVNQYMEIMKIQAQYAFFCGFPQCSATNTGLLFRRCSGCKFVLYCSDICQKKHWRGQHKVLCSEMCSPGREPIHLSGGGLRFITQVVAHDCFILTPQQRQPFVKEFSLGLESRRFILLLDYNMALPDRHVAEVLDFQNPSDISRVFKEAHSLQTSKTWFPTWAATPLQPSATLRCVIPVLVFLPWAWDSEPQVMTAFCTLHRSGHKDEKGTKGPPRIRWLHRI